MGRQMMTQNDKFGGFRFAHGVKTEKLTSDTSLRTSVVVERQSEDEKAGEN